MKVKIDDLTIKAEMRKFMGTDRLEFSIIDKDGKELLISEKQVIALTLLQVAKNLKFDQGL